MLTPPQGWCTKRYTVHMQFLLVDYDGHLFSFHAPLPIGSSTNNAYCCCGGGLFVSSLSARRTTNCIRRSRSFDDVIEYYSNAQTLYRHFTTK